MAKIQKGAANSQVIVMFTKPARRDLSFVTRCVILLEDRFIAAIKGWTRSARMLRKAVTFKGCSLSAACLLEIHINERLNTCLTKCTTAFFNLRDIVATNKNYKKVTIGRNMKAC